MALCHGHKEFTGNYSSDKNNQGLLCIFITFIQCVEFVPTISQFKQRCSVVQFDFVLVIVFDYCVLRFL